MQYETNVLISSKSAFKPESIQPFRTAFADARARPVKLSLKQRLMAPAGPAAFAGGRAFVLGSSVVGMGSLVYYGAKITVAGEMGDFGKTATWPQHVRQRIRATYGYFGAGLAVTAAAAVVAARSPVLLNMMMGNSWVALGVTLAAIMGSGYIVRSIPYTPGFGTKQLAFIGHAAIMGAVLAPLCLLGGPALVRAAWTTAGICGGLSTIAVIAPHDQFLKMGGVLGMGFAAVFAANIGAMFAPAGTALHAGLASITIYGGLVLFSAFMLYDTQKIINAAQMVPYTNPNQQLTFNGYGQQPLQTFNYEGRLYDPINMSMGIYLDTLHIFMRLAMIFSGQRRK